MARSFTADFQTAAMAAHQKPYHVLEIQWTTGTAYYLDRETGTFDASGDRHPATISPCLVVDWGQVSLTMREMQIGSVDSLTVKVEDRDGEVSNALQAAAQQQRTVNVWRMFDEDSVTWGSDQALIFSGILKPHAYSETDNVVSLTIEDPAKSLIGQAELLATREVFEHVPEQYEDRNIPTCWGYAERVEAVLIDAPWKIKTLGPATAASSVGTEIALADHPDELGLPINVEGWYEFSYDRPAIGKARERVKGKFLLSPDKANKPSRFRVTELHDVETINLSVAAVVDRTVSGTASAIVFDSSGDIDDLRGAYFGDPIVTASFRTANGVLYAVRAQVFAGDGANDYPSGMYRVKFISGLLGGGNLVAAAEALAVGRRLTIYWRSPVCNVHSVLDYDVLPADGSHEASYVRKTIKFLVDDFTPEGVMNYSGTPETQVSAVTQFFVNGTWEVPAAATFADSTHTIEYIDDGSFKTTLEYLVPQAGDPESVYATYDYFESVATGTPARFRPPEYGAETQGGLTIGPIDYPWVYAVNSLPSKKIVKVEGRGSYVNLSTTTNQQSDERFVLIGETEQPADEDGVVAVTSDAWTADLADSTWRTQLGNSRDLTTITFAREPRLYSSYLKDNRLWVTLLGTTTAADGYITSPGMVMLTYLKDSRLLGVDESHIDSGSFEQEISGDYGPLKIGFAQIESKPGLEYLQDIARQCRSVLLFDQGRFSLRPLTTSGSWAATFDEGSILENSLERSESDLSDVVTRLTASWRYSWDEFTPARKRTVIDHEAEEGFKPSNKDVEIWIYRDANFVIDELTFWLSRWSQVYWDYTFLTYGRALVLQPADNLRLGYSDGTGREIVPAGTVCEVQSAEDLADGTVRVRARHPQF